MMERGSERRSAALHAACAAAFASALVIGCQRPAVRSEQERSPSPGEATPSPVAPRVQTSLPEQQPSRMAVGLPGVGTCEPAAGVVNVLSRAVDVADANGDGRLSKQEAYASANFLVGGFFFRADDNADGTITPAEGRAARSEVANRYPTLGAALREARESGQQPVAGLLQLVDVEYGQPVTVAQVRDITRNAVDALYARADANEDGTLTVTEARTAAWDSARSAAHAGFQTADTDNDGKLTEAEFRNAMDAPLVAAFKAADSDGNGRLSEPEASSAVRQVAERFGIEAPRAPRPGKSQAAQ